MTKTNLNRGSGSYLTGIVLIAVIGKDFEDGKLSLEEVVDFARKNGEPKQISGQQELYEAIVNMYI